MTIEGCARALRFARTTAPPATGTRALAKLRYVCDTGGTLVPSADPGGIFGVQVATGLGPSRPDADFRPNRPAIFGRRDSYRGADMKFRTNEMAAVDKIVAACDGNVHG